MTSFTEAELEYLSGGERRLGRLATIDPQGRPHVVPLGWAYNREHGTIDISGRNFAATHKFRNAMANPQVALVVDDVLPPWRPRCVLIQGRAQTIDPPGAGDEALIRITPEKIISWGLAEERP